MSRAPGGNGCSVPPRLGTLLGVSGASGSATAIVVFAASRGIATGVGPYYGVYVPRRRAL
ncbi:hypothetical protein [Burkholderia latens]|uniref:Uncharacterized protein n=1 Tax=Burkholderia latens TaxID=488446 RepID=A0A6P2HN95_9BURK|nr:hypothetical protein [Burkholderia latens]VWB19464.1 hypothetical protein BLA24064_00747 [Burkholderia latens]